MSSVHLWFSGVLVFCSLAPPTLAFSYGANPASCKEMIPGHIRAHPMDPGHSYVMVHTSASSYLPGQLITVTVRSSRDFMGFLLQARSVSGKGHRYRRGAGIRSRRLDPLLMGGSWILTPPGTHTLRCLSEGDTITHSDKQLKRNLSFVWRAPDVPMGDVRFIITVVQSYFIYWAGVESAVVHDGSRSVWNSGKVPVVDGVSTVHTIQEERVTVLPALNVNSSSTNQANWTRTTTTTVKQPITTNGGFKTFKLLKTQAEVNQTALRLKSSMTLTNHATSTTNTLTSGSLQSKTQTSPESLSGASTETTFDPVFHPKDSRSSSPLTSSISSPDYRKMDTTTVVQIPTGPLSLSNSPLPFFPQKGIGTQRKDPKIKPQEAKLKTTTSVLLFSQSFHISNTLSDSQKWLIQEETGTETSTVKTKTGLLSPTSSYKPNPLTQTKTSWITFFTSSPKTLNTIPMSALPSKPQTLKSFQNMPITQAIRLSLKHLPRTSPSGPTSITKSSSSPQNTMSLSRSSRSPSLGSFYQALSETTQSQSQTSIVKAETGLLSQTSSTKQNLPFQTPTSHISLLSKTFTPKTQTSSKSVFPFKSPPLKPLQIPPNTQTDSLPRTSPSGHKSIPQPFSSPQTTKSHSSPPQHQSSSSFHQVQLDTVLTQSQPSLPQRDQSQSEVPEETFRTSSRTSRFQTLFLTVWTLSPQPINNQFFTLEKDLRSQTNMKTTSTVLDLVPPSTSLPSVLTLSHLGSSSSSDMLDSLSSVFPSEPTSFRSIFPIQVSLSSSKNQPRTIPALSTLVSTPSSLPSVHRSSTTSQQSFLTYSSIRPSNSYNNSANSSFFSSVPVSPSSPSLNSSKRITSSYFSSSSFSTASQRLSSSSSSQQNPNSFVSSLTSPSISFIPPSSLLRPSSSSVSTIVTLHSDPSSSPHYFLQSVSPSKKTTVSGMSVSHTHLTSSNPEPNLRSVVHPNPKPFLNHNLNNDQETKPNVPNINIKPKRPSDPSKTPDKEGKYPDIIPRHSSWELGMLLGCSAGLGMVLVVGVRYVYRQACGRRTEVTLKDREREYGRGLIQVQECGDLVRVRKIRENSFVLLTEYDVLAPPGN